LKDSKQRLFLAVDGGILASEAALLTGAGDVLARVRTGGTSPQDIGPEAAADAVEAMYRDAVAAAGPAGTGALSRAVVFMAGVDLPEERRALRTALSARFREADLIVENDIHGVLWAGMRRPAGVAVICGSGINALARSATGRTAGYLALGTVSGEWGGALSLGREVLFAASRAEDGRGPQTSLRYQVAAYFRRASVRDAVAELHTGRAPAGALVELADLLFEADANGDAVARALVDRLAQEIVTMASAAMNRATVPPTGSDVVLAGSLLTAGHSRFDDLVDSGFAASLPGAAVRRLQVPTIVGAALACLGADRGGPLPDEKQVRHVADALAAADRRTRDLEPA